jgi:ATP-dependent DNA ligase
MNSRIAWPKGIRAASYPGWRSPRLATLTKKRFSREDWIYERKLDGMRCLVYCRAGGITSGANPRF